MELKLNKGCVTLLEKLLDVLDFLGKNKSIFWGEKIKRSL